LEHYQFRSHTFVENLDDFDIALSLKGIRFVAYDGDNRAPKIKQRIDVKNGKAKAFSGVVS
jgi:ATP-dependent DNA helicase RecG